MYKPLILSKVFVVKAFRQHLKSHSKVAVLESAAGK